MLDNKVQFEGKLTFLVGGVGGIFLYLRGGIFLDRPFKKDIYKLICDHFETPIYFNNKLICECFDNGWGCG